MKKQKLKPSDKRLIRGVNRTDVELTVAGLKPFLERSQWIGTHNYYGQKVVERLNAGAPSTAARERHLAQYIAASLSLHANDGWSYLGRAASCLLAGDTHRALHLAYYAELRAAMSLLASAGVGIFNNKHYVISGKNSTTKLSSTQGTHIMAWLALEEWSRNPASGVFFSSLIRPEGRSLDEWFHPLGGTSSLAPQAKAWFMQWGMDLGITSKDREARNESSYRPDGVPTTWEVYTKDGLEFIRDMWSSLEPGSASSFEQIDRHILRLAVERHHFGITSRQASATDPTYVALVDGIVEPQSLSTATDKRLKDFLLRHSSPTDPLVFRYSAIKPGEPLTDAFAVMARSVLLLRVATGAAHMLFKRAGFDIHLLGFWWQKLGQARGLWRPGSAPDELADLWADVEDSLRDIDDLESSSPQVLDSFHAVSEVLPRSLKILASHERVGLWGLCPS